MSQLEKMEGGIGNSFGGAGGAGGKRVRPRSATLHSEVYLNFPEKPAKIGV